MSEIGRKVGARIAVLRKRAGLTQQTLADKLGTAAAVISRMEHGVNAPSLERLGEIADAIGVPPADLLMFDGSDAPAGQRGTVTLHRLSAEEAKLIVGIAELLRSVKGKR